MNTELFIEKSNKIHNNKYDYSKSEYISHKSKICIICKEHGEFLQSPYDHLKGKGCPKCARNVKLTTNEFIEKLREKYGDSFDYSKVEYENSKTKICLICPIHGEFWQTPSKLLVNKFPCYKCSIESRANKRRAAKIDFIKEANEVHGDKYDYSKVDYKNNRTKVCIICPKHGEFWQTPESHLRTFGCSLCSNEHRAKTKTKSNKDIIRDFVNLHKNRYIYSKVQYNGASEKVCIICPKHGEFWQTPSNHLQGRGCPICNQSNLEKVVGLFLEESKIKNERQKTFEWLINKKPMKLDFYLPQYNVAIECQGIQHFEEFVSKANGWFDGEKDQMVINKRVIEVIERDDLKRKLCEEHGIKIFYYSNLGIEYPYEVYEDFGKMLEDIKKI